MLDAIGSGQAFDFPQIKTGTPVLAPTRSSNTLEGNNAEEIRGF
jgi:hypothetical protein